MSNHVHKIAQLITEDPDIFTESKCPTEKGGCGNTQAYLGLGMQDPECPNKNCKYYTTEQEKDIYPDKFKPKQKPKTTNHPYQKTIEFVQAVADDNARLSYAALAIAAQALGENNSKQIQSQLGRRLVQILPTRLQDNICRRNGSHIGYTNIPKSFLNNLPIIRKDKVLEAIKVWQKHSSSNIKLSPPFRLFDPYGVLP